MEVTALAFGEDHGVLSVVVYRNVFTPRLVMGFHKLKGRIEKNRNE